MIALPQKQDEDCPQTGAAYLAFAGYEHVLEQELAHRGLAPVFRRDRLFGTRQPPRKLVWAQNTWLEPLFLPITSISDGARQLKALQRNWALYATTSARRGVLIHEALPKVSAKPLVFGDSVPDAPLGSFTLWNNGCILASPRCSSPFVNGEVNFVEDRQGPPNRAYLKIWEALTRIGKMPGPKDLCLDLGGSPGGWSWVLASLGARVFCIDKAPLAPNVARNPLVESCIGSAFALTPQMAEGCSWLFCDVACYPEKLYKTVLQWIDSGVQINMVCTVKFTGATDFAITDSFARLPGSDCVHLFFNKHEITWIRLVNQ
ncbi:hypothetical protein LJC46_01085 [Desulfovibrio sp. OttesenSCG-928-G15]|nr:hypothetical protein [Desulfovibrio sp. OttesenSCG-928-G15]